MGMIMLTVELRQKSSQMPESFQVRLLELCQDVASLALVSLLVKASLSCAGSPHYSEDFEEEEGGGEDAKDHPDEVCVQSSGSSGTVH